MESKKNTLIVVVVIAVALIFVTVLSIGALILGHSGRGLSKGKTGGKVAVIRVEGVITGGRGSSGVLGGESGAGAERIIDMLEQFRRDDSVRSLVLRINSPGGSAAGSQEVYQEVNRCRKEGKKVTVSMGDVAASGGYYIASAADRIYANPATMTGSIGVIMETADISGLLNKYNINLGAIKSGKHKDIGSPTRAMTPDEKALLQGLINDVFDQFVTDVSIGRHMPKAAVRKIADGSVFTGRQAIKLGLVDKTGSMQDALRAAADDAGIKGDIQTVE